MDYDDRKSAVSSFYGAPRGSFDALNTDFPQQPPRRDRASSFYGPRNSGADPYDSSPAGYNKADAGRKEPVFKGDPEFDVIADFNNAGPRYSTAFVSNKGYQQLDAPSPTPYNPQAGAVKGSVTSLTGGEQTSGVEMVTVPALGPEWGRDELKGMSDKERRRENLEDMTMKWKKWKRGETGMCGKYFTRRFTAWFVFGLCAAVALVLAFTIPRVPSFSTNQAEPLSSATSPYNETIPVGFSHAPANFSFPGAMKLQADTGSNFLPLSFKNIHGTVFDLNTNAPVATGDTGHVSVPAKAFPVINLNLNFTYNAINDSDTTWNNWYSACRNKAIYTNNQRPVVQFRLVLDMDIEGLIGKKSTSTQVTDAACPIELSLNAP